MLAMLDPRGGGEAQTYPVNNPQERQQQRDDYQHPYRALLPVRDLVGRIQDDTPPDVEDLAGGVHGGQDDGAQGIVAAALQDDVGPAEQQRVDDIRGAGAVEGEHGGRERDLGNDEDHGRGQLQRACQDAHRHSAPRGVNVHGRHEVGHDTDGLDAEGVRVDLCLGEEAGCFGLVL